MDPTVIAAIIGGISGIVAGVVGGWIVAVVKTRQDLIEQYDLTVRARRIELYTELGTYLEPLARFSPPKDTFQYWMAEKLSQDLRAWYFREGGLYLSSKESHWARVARDNILEHWERRCTPDEDGFKWQLCKEDTVISVRRKVEPKEAKEELKDSDKRKEELKKAEEELKEELKDAVEFHVRWKFTEGSRSAYFALQEGLTHYVKELEGDPNLLNKPIERKDYRWLRHMTSELRTRLTEDVGTRKTSFFS